MSNEVDWSGKDKLLKSGSDSSLRKGSVVGVLRVMKLLGRLESMVGKVLVFAGRRP